MARPNFKLPEPLPLPVADVPPRKNTLDTVGLVLSALALLTLGILSPIAMVVCLIGMSWQPRLLAGIGVLVSAMGCVLAITIGLVGMRVYTFHLKLEREKEQFVQDIQKIEQWQQDQTRKILNPDDARLRLKELVDKLDSRTQEERDQLNSGLQDVVQSIEDIQREAEGLAPRTPEERTKSKKPESESPAESSSASRENENRGIGNAP